MTTVALAAPQRRGLAPAVAAASGLAAAMGVGRFVYTPLLPLMVDAHRITAYDGALIATANYAGYLLGALLLTWRPALHDRRVFLASAGLLIASEALMAVPGPILFPAVLRLVAGIASAVIFVACASFASRPGSGGQSAGIVFGGIGFGIASTGLLVLALRPVLSWQLLWLVSAALTAALLIPVWRLDIRAGHRVPRGAARVSRSWRALLAAYFLEGLGYIVIGTFSVAAVSAERGPVTGSAMWIVVGAAAAVSTVLWAAAARCWSPAALLPVALGAQCVSAMLPAVSGALWAAVTAATLFGGTFVGIVMLAMRVGAELTDSAAAAPLTAGYGAGQILGPVVVAPVLGTSYSAAFVIAAVVLGAAALTAGAVTAGIRRT
ncbi:YbfB/YjiJ family MFS transporter [Nocardia araoensis]|uniref:YbfB/YjiJ family MFS transporter n=1 Tax=Nocardia araoensis TaxID=228600 RepID=UPI0002ED853C|nr:YbfB/YjiJ family MFS transporter [Nocardia araoensis]